jgi:hypothetical protein
MTLTRALRCRFYGTLNRFLAPSHRYRAFSCAVKGVPAIKDTLEALGVPHTEIDCIVVNGRAVTFSYHIRGGERILVYPDAGMVRLKKIIRRSLKPNPPANPKFILDVHLGKLARHLRLLGFDVFYGKESQDAAIVRLGRRTGRIILTRDIALLKNKSVRRGYFVRSRIASGRLMASAALSNWRQAMRNTSESYSEETMTFDMEATWDSWNFELGVSNRSLRRLSRRKSQNSKFQTPKKTQTVGKFQTAPV